MVAGNRGSSRGFPPAAPLEHRHGGRLSSMTGELSIHGMGDDYTVEGNGTIKSLPAMPVGMSAVLRILGTPTFTNSTKLICPNGVDYVASAGDLCIARSDGDGVWRLFVLPTSGVALADRALSLTSTQRGNAAANLQLIAPPQGRLTALTGTPVLITSVSNTGGLYYAPYVGNTIPIYDGTNMIPTAFSELLNTTVDTTKNPAAVVASSVYDMFVWNDSGTIRLSRGPVWTNDTTRSAGTALVMVGGILLNSVSITNGPGASRGTYVGTIRSNSSNGGQYTFGTAASGGGAAFLGVWNMYNRVSTGTTVTDTGANYTYASATVRQARASAGNQIQFVLGLQEDAILFSRSGEVVTPATATALASVGVGFDVTNAYSVQKAGVYTGTANAVLNEAMVSGAWSAPIGFHTLASVENTNGVGTSTFNNNSLDYLSAIIRN